MVGVTYQEIHLFVEFLKEQYGQGRPDYIEALNDLDGLAKAFHREDIERFLEDELRQTDSNRWTETHNRAKRREDNRVFEAVRFTEETNQSAGA